MLGAGALAVSTGGAAALILVGIVAELVYDAVRTGGFLFQLPFFLEHFRLFQASNLFIMAGFIRKGTLTLVLRLVMTGRPVPSIKSHWGMGFSMKEEAVEGPSIHPNILFMPS